MKEQALIDDQIKSIQDHKGNISSNLGDNLPFKEKLEDIVNNAASIHTEFNVALNGICNVIKKINTFVHSMEARKIDSRKIKGPNPETQYYPNHQIISEGDLTSNPQVGGAQNIMNNVNNGVAMKPSIKKAIRPVKGGKTKKSGKKHSQDEGEEPIEINDDEPLVEEKSEKKSGKKARKEKKYRRENEDEEEDEN